MACIGDLPEQLLQRLFAQVLTSSGLHGRCGWALPAVCRQWRAIWADEALWASSAVHRRLGSQATRASAAAARATYSCGWQPAWRAALTQRRNWQLDPARRVPRRGVQILRKAVAADSDGLTSLDCDASFRRVAVGCFAQSVRIYALPSPQSGREGGQEPRASVCGRSGAALCSALPYRNRLGRALARRGASDYGVVRWDDRLARHCRHWQPLQ